MDHRGRDAHRNIQINLGQSQSSRTLLSCQCIKKIINLKRHIWHNLRTVWYPAGSWIRNHQNWCLDEWTKTASRLPRAHAKQQGNPNGPFVLVRKQVNAEGTGNRNHLVCRQEGHRVLEPCRRWQWMPGWQTSAARATGTPKAPRSTGYVSAVTLLNT